MLWLIYIDEIQLDASFPWNKATLHMVSPANVLSSFKFPVYSSPSLQGIHSHTAGRLWGENVKERQMAACVLRLSRTFLKLCYGSNLHYHNMMCCWLTSLLDFSRSCGFGSNKTCHYIKLMRAGHKTTNIIILACLWSLWLSMPKTDWCPNPIPHMPTGCRAGTGNQMA